LLGLGTIARLVDAFARRLTLQEQIGASVTQALCEAAGARGAFCQLSLVHGCLSARGSHRERASVTTISRRGDMENPAIDCDLAMALGARPGSEEQS
jgi:GTP cyclohydrolase I